MKKALVLVFAVMFGLVACAEKEQIIKVNQLPAKAQTIVSTYFADLVVSYVKQEKEITGMEYEVRMQDGTKIEFDKNGEVKSVDCGVKEVPADLVPQAVRDYVAQNFAGSFITEWGKDDNRWKAELNSGLELVFDKNYNFIRIDD